MTKKQQPILIVGILIVIAAIIYFVSQVCNLNISKKTINNISEISEVTINKCYKKLEQLNITLIPKKIIEKYTIDYVV